VSRGCFEYVVNTFQINVIVFNKRHSHRTHAPADDIRDAVFNNFYSIAFMK